MRYQGRLMNWKDDKGFGFVMPNGGGDKAFVHIKAFSRYHKRPADKDLVTYEVAYDAVGRLQAENVLLVSEPARRAPSARSTAPLLLTIAFVLVMAASALLGAIPYLIPLYYLVASATAFTAYAIDKSAAQQDRWRTQETTLHFFSLVGGWPGAVAAQYMLRHKSRKKAFLAVFWITVALNCGGLYWLVQADGAQHLRQMIGMR